MVKKLEPFQEVGADFLARNFHALLADQPGLGKTIQAISAANRIAAQKMLVVCPASVRSSWREHIAQWAFFPQNWRVVSYEQAVKLVEKAPPPRQDVVILDECFPAETLIQTARGPVSIGELVSTKKPESLLSCDLSTNALEYMPLARVIKKRRRGRLVRVTHEAGSFVCTPNHKIWTRKGYALAATLESGAYLRLVPGRIFDDAQGQKYRKVLRENVCRHLRDGAHQTERRDKPTEHKTTCQADLRRMSAAIPSESFGHGTSAVLRKVVQRHVANAAAGRVGKSADGPPGAAPLETWVKGPRSGSTDAPPQSHETESCARQNESRATGAHFPSTRRQWRANAAADKVGRGIGLADRACHLDGEGSWEIPVAPPPLQSGFGESANGAGYRGRRANSSSEEVALPGQTQDRGAQFSRVVCVEILEQGDRRECRGGSCKNQYVYNLEVAKNHNYFADGVLVSNCHFTKTPQSLRTQAIFGNGRGIARNSSYVWGLSGTPVLNRPRELWPILKCLNPAFKDMTFATFAMRYCGAYWDGFGLNTKGASHLNELAGLLNGFMLRRTKREVFPDRREPDVQLVPLEVSDKDLAAVWEEEQSILNREALLSPAAEDFAALGDLSRLLRLTGEAKVPAATAYLSDLLESGVDKVVVFFHHREVGRKLFDALASRGMKPAIYQGGLSDAQKAEQVAKFQTPDCRVFLGQIQAAGVGINGLQEVCSDVVFAEQPWVPGQLEQAIDRLDRIGQSRDFVTARILHAPGTLESAVLYTRLGKSKVISAVVDGGDVLRGMW